MNRVRSTMRALLLAFACTWADMGHAAAPTLPPQAQPPRKIDELGEVLVQGTRQRPKQPGFKAYEHSFSWLARMVGTFVIDGTVDAHAQGRQEDLHPVNGRAVCVGFGAAPGVQCDLKVRWPDSVPGDSGAMTHALFALDPSSALFGLDLVSSGVSYILVDGNGFAETAIGEMISADTMVSRSRCSTVAGNCERVTRFNASADLKTITVSMVLRVDQAKVATFDFVMHRVPGRPSVVYGRQQKKAGK